MGVREARGEGQGLGVGGRALGAGDWQAERAKESKTREIKTRGVRRRDMVMTF
jgi:hypothetical protein